MHAPQSLTWFLSLSSVVISLLARCSWFLYASACTVDRQQGSRGHVRHINTPCMQHWAGSARYTHHANGTNHTLGHACGLTQPKLGSLGLWPAVYADCKLQPQLLQCEKSGQALHRQCWDHKAYGVFLVVHRRGGPHGAATAALCGNSVSAADLSVLVLLLGT
jgi:hypothetical protein